MASKQPADGRDAALPLSRTEASIHLYSEHLLHIRALSLTASLSTDSTPLTKAVLSADGCSLSITHEDASATIVLPTAIQGGSNTELELPREKARELSLRLMLQEKEKGSVEDAGVRLPVREEGNWVPWSATALQGRRGWIKCAQCGEKLVRFSSEHVGGKSLGSEGVSASITSPDDRTRTIREWRDLPNENWAEMMDFWHCHKPPLEENEAGDTTSVGAAKGYAAGNKLRAAEGIGFVDLETFLFSESNCQSMLNTLLACKDCASELGVVDESADGWRIWKRCVKLAFDGSGPNEDGGVASSVKIEQRSLETLGEPDPREREEESNQKEESYDVRKWISAHFLALIDNQGVRKFEVRDAYAATADAVSSGDGVDREDENEQGKEGSERLLLWIFTPDLTFSSVSYPGSSAQHTADYNRPTRAMKVLWKVLGSPSHHTTSKGANTSSSSTSSSTITSPQQQANKQQKQLPTFSPASTPLTASQGETSLPTPIYASLRANLVETQLLLPRASRAFQGWNVGLLPRFDAADMEGRV